MYMIMHTNKENLRRENHPPRTQYYTYVNWCQKLLKYYLRLNYVQILFIFHFSFLTYVTTIQFTMWRLIRDRGMSLVFIKISSKEKKKLSVSSIRFAAKKLSTIVQGKVSDTKRKERERLSIHSVKNAFSSIRMYKISMKNYKFFFVVHLRALIL